MKKDFVLIIDDSETNTLLLQSTLQVNGFKVQTANSAEEGWMMLYDHKPRIILLDLLMPKVSGFQFLSKLKSNKQYADIPVIIVSALSDPETIKSMINKGADDFFTKPINLISIVNRVSKYF